VLATYSFSKYLEELSRLNPTDNRYEKRLSNVDSPHRLAMSGIWELPFGKGRAWGAGWNRTMDLILGGFQIQGILQYQSGFPLTVGNIYFNGSFAALPPEIRSSTIGVLGSSNINDNVFLTDIRSTPFYFSDDAVRTNGQLDYTKQRNDPRINLSQNIRTLSSRTSAWRNMGITMLDLSVIKNFNFTERVRLQFRTEAINALNRAHFNAPVLNPRDANFGRVTNTDSPTNPREFQLGLRLVF
jgi:hypothetical protein